MIYESKEIEGFPWELHVEYRTLQDNWGKIHGKIKFSYEEKGDDIPIGTTVIWSYMRSDYVSGRPGYYVIYFANEEIAIQFATAMGQL